MLGEPKTVIVGVRLSPRDRAAIDKAAVKAHMNTSQFMRACTLTMMAADLDGHALRMLAVGISDAATEFVSTLRSKKVRLT